MRIGLDVDGVLAGFNKAYIAQTILFTGENKFLPDDAVDPPVWNYPELRGYTPEQMSGVWETIITDEVFWLNLPAIEENTSTLTLMLKTLERHHDVYYVTARPGIRAKRQTEIWLYEMLGYPMRVPGVWPTVVISSDKGGVAKALKLNAYIDDNLDNIVQVARQSPETRAYLLNRRYNADPATAPEHAFCTRIESLSQMFDREIAAGRL